MSDELKPPNVTETRPDEERMSLLGLVAQEAAEYLDRSLETNSPDEIVAAVNNCVRAIKKGTGPAFPDDAEVDLLLDYRDVIVAGEYDSVMNQVRDLRVSFLIASPDDFWISETALTTHKRGYLLIQLNWRPATTGPFEYACDSGEGIATFCDGTSAISIEKRAREWLLVHEGFDLRPYGLDASFDDEKRFRIQLDYYLSRK